jgi:flavin reductase (DIM6/NTAB) family NADH-FMN oxidoreductase RutF
MKKVISPQTILYPAPSVLVSCVSGSGKANIITLAWVGTVCSEPPMVSISVRPGRFSYKLISETKEFVINIPTTDIVDKVEYCGIHSGKDVDKFKETGLTPMPATKVRVTLIKECPVNIECKVKDEIHLGSHNLFLGEIVAIDIDEEILTEEGRINYLKAKPIIYNNGEYWKLGERLPISHR